MLCPLLEINSAKTGVELMAVQRGIREGARCYPTWTPSDMNLSDCMTKVSFMLFVFGLSTKVERLGSSASMQSL